MFKYILISFVSAFGALKLQGTLFELNTFHFLLGLFVLTVLFYKEFFSIKSIYNPVKTVNLIYLDKSDILIKRLSSKITKKVYTGYTRSFNGVIIRNYSEILPVCPSGSTVYYYYEGQDSPTGKYLIHLIIIDQNNCDITSTCITDLANLRVKKEQEKNKESFAHLNFIQNIGKGSLC